MTRPLAESVQRWLAGQGHALFGQPQPPLAVTVRTASTGTVFLAELQFGDGPKRVAVKQIAGDAIIPCPANLCRLHEIIRARDPRLAAAMPAFLGHEPDARLVAMEFVAGRPLNELLANASWWPGWREAQCRAWLAAAAGVLAALHDIPARAIGVPSEVRRHDFFTSALEEGWTDPRIQAWLPPAFRDPERLYRDLSADFFDRSDDQLTPRDAQAKNTLVAANGQVAYIDFDYLGGCPAVGVAHYLVSLDRLQLRYPLGWRGRRIAGWKQCFVDHYAKARPGVVAELRFFYPWSLMKNYLHQVSYRPRSGWYLARFYGRCLRTFLEHRDAAEPNRRGAGDSGLFATACQRCRA